MNKEYQEEEILYIKIRDILNENVKRNPRNGNNQNVFVLSTIIATYLAMLPKDESVEKVLDFIRTASSIEEMKDGMKKSIMQ